MIAAIEKELLHNYNEAYKKVKKQAEETIIKMEIIGVEDVAKKQILMNEHDRLAKLCKSLAADIQHINEISVGIINNNLYETYAINYEYGAYLVEHESGYDLGYNLFNRNTIKEIVKEQLTPFTKMAYNGLLDKNTIIRDLTRELTQSILIGESIPDLAKRIKSITEKNMNDSIRIARTEMNRCESAGRQDAFKYGEELGLKLKKQWISTIDKRTRHSHRKLHLQIRELDEPFSNGLIHPSAVGGKAKEVCNCRCAMVSIFDGIKQSAKAIELDEKLKNMSLEEWKDNKVITKPYKPKKKVEKNE